jgi:hypothetical protein
VGGNAGDFRFQLDDARIKLIARIAVQAFAAKQAGGIAAGAGAIIVFHCGAASDARRLLSTAVAARGTITVMWWQWGDNRGRK